MNQQPTCMGLILTITPFNKWLANQMGSHMCTTLQPTIHYTAQCISVTARCHRKKPCGEGPIFFYQAQHEEPPNTQNITGKIQVTQNMSRPS